MEFHVLGPLEVTSGGQALPVGGPRTRTVLALLLVNANRVVASDRLIGELWPDYGQDRGADNLQVRLSELRRGLRSVGEGDRLTTRLPGYVLRVEGEELDAARFSALVADGRAALADDDPGAAVSILDRALELWRGPALADLDDLDFVRGERGRLDEERLGALELRIDALVACGRHRETIAELETLTVAHPLRERLWYQRLLALYRSGRQADALRAYREFRGILVEQLGLEPGRDLRELEAGILRQAPELDHRPTAGNDGGPAVPETRYAESGGVHIACQVLGSGERDLVFVPGAMSHLELLWENAATAAFFHGLGRLARLILFDKRDTGLSDRAPADSPLEERVDDVRAVMQAAGSERATLFGYSEGGPMSVLFAATHPDRVRSLILGAATARYLPARDYPCGHNSAAMFAALEEIAAHRWGQGATIEWFMPSHAGDPEAREAFARFERMAVSPSAFLRIVRMIREIDVRGVLPAIHVPTLVIQRLEDRMTPVCHGRYLAANIAGARYFEQHGDHSLRFSGSGDTDRLLAEIRDFLDAEAGERVPDRVLATVLVAAADSPPALGQSEETIRREVQSHRGRLLRSGPDLALATFDAPGRAIRCAAAVADAVRSGGTPLRFGIHTGEIERRDGGISGASVAIAERIAAAAGAGEILVSRTVKDLVVGAGMAFAERGSEQLAGTTERWPLFAVTAVAG